MTEGRRQNHSGKRSAKAWKLRLQEQRPVFAALQMLPRGKRIVEVWELQMREPRALDRGAAKLQRRAAFGARTARVKSVSCCDTNMTSKGDCAERE
jgi:hypothetical protein